MKLSHFFLVGIFWLAGFGAAKVLAASARTSAAPGELRSIFAEAASLERPLCLKSGKVCYTNFATGKCCTGWCQCFLDPFTRRCRNTLGQCTGNDGIGPRP